MNTLNANSSAIAGNRLQLSRESLKRFCAFITAELGIKMTEAKLPMLQSRLQRRLNALGLPSLEEYQKYLFNSPNAAAERSHFFDEVTTNKTDFFREPSHFDYLSRVILPEADPGRRAWTFRVWCAGCSSGEEIYTLAITLAEFAETRPGFEFSLLGTDISTRVLAHAEQAIYDESRLAPVPTEIRRKYFLRHRDPARSVVRVAPELRSKTSFRRLNFMDENYAVRQTFDAIFFRNVMIYFDRPTQERVVNRLCRNLRPGGHLFIGHSESLAGLDVPAVPIGASVFSRIQ